MFAWSGGRSGVRGSIGPDPRSGQRGHISADGVRWERYTSDASIVEAQSNGSNHQNSIRSANALKNVKFKIVGLGSVNSILVPS
jgi:hypothetical protein